VLDVTKGRIPFLGIGARFNLMPDLNCFDADGGVDYTKSSIPENCVVCMDLPAGPLGMYRQPSGNPEEQVLTTNVHDRRFKRFRGRNRIIMGSMAWYYLSLMGGGDMDDAVNAVVDGIWLEFMDKARNYPITPLPEAQKTVSLDDNNKYRRTPRYPRFWSKVDAFEATAAAKERKLSIGPVVNAVMLDILLSGEHKENMLTTLADQIAEKGADAYAFTKSIGIGENATYQTYTLGMVYDWLRNRPDHILRVVGSNLEAFIDYVKMGKGDPTVLEPLVKLITEVRDSSLVIPQSFLIERKLKGQTRVRVTERRLLARDFWVLPSLVCDALNQIKFEVDQLQEALVEEQWLNVDSLPESLSLAFPKDQASRDEAIDLRMKWGAAFSNRSGSDLESIYKSVVEEVVDPAFNRPDFNADIKMALAVEHARFTYKGRKTEARRNEDGSRRNYPDGLLWTNTVGTWYIKALEAAGLTGLYAPVEFDRWSRNYSRGEYQVNVIGNEVFNAIDGTYFGEVSDPEVTNGNYIMSDGMLTVIEPSTELYEDRNIVDETYSNPVDLGIDSELEALLASL
jgi:hypothetical protein